MLAIAASSGLLGASAQSSTFSPVFGPNWPPPGGLACRPSDADEQKAKSLYEIARRAHHSGDYGTAFRYYRDAYTFDCSAHILVSNIAKVLEADGQYLAALDALRLYAERRKPTGEELQALDRRIDSLAKKATTAASASAAAVSSTDSASAEVSEPPPAPAPTIASDPPRPPAPPPVLQPPRRATWPAWITMGSGVVLAAAGAVVAGAADARAARIARTSDELFNRLGCFSNACAAEQQRAGSALSDAEGLRTAGFVALGSGSAALIGGFAWYLLAPRPTADATNGSIHMRFTATPWTLSVGGTF